MKSRLDLIEGRLQAFIESSVHLFPWGSPQHSLASRLVEAMQSSLITDESGEVSAAHFYTIYMNPEELTLWQSHQGLFDELAQVLQEAALDGGVNFPYPPMIVLAEKPDLSFEAIQVIAALPNDTVGDTTTLTVEPEEPAEEPRAFPENAFLIVDGTHVFQLQQPVINIGRRSDNHLVIDDPRVSRSHAQLRIIRGHYVIFDLNSTGGTFVNSQRVNQCTLKPGDVVSIAGIPLIYGEDVPNTKGETSEYNLGKESGPEMGTVNT